MGNETSDHDLVPGSPLERAIRRIAEADEIDPTASVARFSSALQ